MRNVDWHASTEESTPIPARGYEGSAKIDVNNLGVKWRVKFQGAEQGAILGVT